MIDRNVDRVIMIMFRQKYAPKHSQLSCIFITFFYREWSCTGIEQSSRQSVTTRIKPVGVVFTRHSKFPTFITVDGFISSAGAKLIAYNRSTSVLYVCLSVSVLTKVALVVSLEVTTCNIAWGSAVRTPTQDNSPAHFPRKKITPPQKKNPQNASWESDNPAYAPCSTLYM